MVASLLASLQIKSPAKVADRECCSCSGIRGPAGGAFVLQLLRAQSLIKKTSKVPQEETYT